MSILEEFPVLQGFSPSSRNKLKEFYELRTIKVAKWKKNKTKFRKDSVTLVLTLKGQRKKAKTNVQRLVF